MALANEYEKLLRYLENVEPKKVAAKQQPKPKKEPTKKELASENTKKLLAEATIDDFIDLPTVHINKGSQSKSFDITQFESMMRSKLIEEHKTRQSYERPYISVSELYVCLRQNYYVRKRFQINIKSQFQFSYLYLIQKVGNLIHEVFQDLYNFTEVEKSVVSEKFKVKGRLDAVKGKTIYEIKSIDPAKFKGSYIKEHLFQGLIYAYILVTEYDYDIDNITIIYVLRNLKTIYAFDIDLDMKLAESFLTRAPILLSALDQNITPEPIGATEEQCKWCPYKSYCENDGFHKIKPPFMKKQKQKQEVQKKETPKKKTAPEAKFLL
jgi:CRISPR/Cas system-associated exonuclease Cas4 (RecB family)